MTCEETDRASIIPAPLTAPPSVLEVAKQHLEVATNEFYIALQRFYIWRVLAYDCRLVERLGKGFATGGYINIRSAMFEVLLITITRMFDQGARGRQPLSLETLCNAICRPESRTFVISMRSAVMRDFPERSGLSSLIGETERAAFEAQAEKDAAAAEKKATQEFNALVRLQRALRKPRIRDALARLEHLRNTDVAHRDLAPVATTLSRPLYRDLDTLFGAAAVLIRRMNVLARDLDINYADFSHRARLRALAFVQGIRAETPAERQALQHEIRSSNLP